MLCCWYRDCPFFLPVLCPPVNDLVSHLWYLTLVVWSFWGLHQASFLTKCPSNSPLGSRITEDRDWSHEIKRHLLIGRKALTNLDSVLKSRDITLPTKGCIVKAMVTPLVTYRCERWNIKKAECRTPDASELWCWRRLLRVPCSDQSVLKEINPEYSLEGCWSWSSSTLATWHEEPTHWKRPWYWGRLRVGGERGDRGWDEMVGWHHWLNGCEMSLSKLWEIVKDREAWCAAVHGVPKSWTRLSDWTTTNSLSLSPYPSSVPSHKLNPPNIP